MCFLRFFDLKLSRKKVLEQKTGAPFFLGGGGQQNINANFEVYIKCSFTLVKIDEKIR